jgi:hypothetical protein
MAALLEHDPDPKGALAAWGHIRTSPTWRRQDGGVQAVTCSWIIDDPDVPLQTGQHVIDFTLAFWVRLVDDFGLEQSRIKSWVNGPGDVAVDAGFRENAADDPSYILTIGRRFEACVNSSVFKELRDGRKGTVADLIAESVAWSTHQLPWPSVVWHYQIGAVVMAWIAALGIVPDNQSISQHVGLMRCDEEKRSAGGKAVVIDDHRRVTVAKQV